MKLLTSISSGLIVAAYALGAWTVGPLAAAQEPIELDTPDFTLKLLPASQTVAALEPKQAAGFDFTPADQLEARSGDGFFHLGDLTLRLRRTGTSEWNSYSTAARRQPVTAPDPARSTTTARACTPCRCSPPFANVPRTSTCCRSATRARWAR